MQGYQPKRPIDLISLPLHSRSSESVESFAQHIRELHGQINKKMNASNETYKCLADSHSRPQEFHEGDLVMIRIRPEQFPSGTLKKLQA